MRTFCLTILALGLWVLAGRPSVVGHADSPASRAQAAISLGAGTPLPTPSAETENSILKAYGSIPLVFEANQGQVDKQVRFLSHGAGYTLFLTGDGAVLKLEGTAHPSEQRDRDEGPSVVRLKLVGANPASVSGLEEQSGKTHYLVGNDPARWRTNIANYSKVKYSGAYPGVDVVYYGNRQQLEYDFVVAPGADPRAILLEVESDSGVTLGSGKLKAGGPARHPVRINANGDLMVTAGGRDVRFSKPIIYQLEGQVASPGRDAVQSFTSPTRTSPTRRPIDGRWILKDRTNVGFEVAAYDPSKPLIIDPALNYSTYLGGSAYDATFGVALDSLGSAYVTGDTASADFPTTPGAFQTGYAGDHDAFVTKLNQTGTALVYSTYIGGGNYDRGVGIAVDSTGSAYVVGTTGSKNFPVTKGAFQTVCLCLTNSPDAFVSKLNPAGSALVYSTYLGGSSSTYGSAIVVDGSFDAFVAGRTCSSDFPVTAGAFQTHYGGGCTGTVGGDAYVTELDSTGSAAVYSSYLGGSGVDAAYAIGLDPTGNAYVSGNTNSLDFPTTSGAFQTTEGGGYDTFVAKVNPTGTALVYSTYIGGSADETTWGITADASGSAYLAGQTQSTNFPTTPGAFQTTCGGGCAKTKGFVTKLDPTGAALSYSTFLGGSGADTAFAIAIDGSGSAYVTGETGSTNFPTTLGSFQATSPGGVEAFVTRLNAAGSAPLYSTFFYGNSTTTGLAIAVDNTQHSFVVAGRTYSTSLPTTPGAYATTCSTCTQVNKASDGFIADFIAGNQIWPLTLNFGDQVVGTNSATLKATLNNSSASSLTVSSILVGGANMADFVVTKNTCGSAVAIGSSCSIYVQFRPSISGAENATLTVTDSGANSPQQVILQGAGTFVKFTPARLTFAKQTVGTQSAPQQITLTNTGSVAVNISTIGITGANSGDFSQTSTCGASVAPKGTCSIGVIFTPTAKGARNAAVSVSDDAGGSPQQATLAGVGN